ncbi:KH domain-containing protein, partial [Arthrospira platensis SPKY1]|nr:KH domain-containing protein [Arthrospira platensis SPKY1]
MNQAREGRLHILGEMLKTLAEPRKELKPHAPKIIKMEIPKEFIGAVIGPGGKIIQGIQADTQTVITLEEVGDKGMIEISGTDAQGMAEAEQRIRDIAFMPVVGTV